MEPAQENVNVENNVVEREHFVRRSTRTTKAPERYGDHAKKKEKYMQHVWQV